MLGALVGRTTFVDNRGRPEPRIPTLVETVMRGCGTGGGGAAGPKIRCDQQIRTVEKTNKHGHVHL